MPGEHEIDGVGESSDANGVIYAVYCTCGKVIKATSSPTGTGAKIVAHDLWEKHSQESRPDT